MGTPVGAVVGFLVGAGLGTPPWIQKQRRDCSKLQERTSPPIHEGVGVPEVVVESPVYPLTAGDADVQSVQSNAPVGAPACTPVHGCRWEVGVVGVNPKTSREKGIGVGAGLMTVPHVPNSVGVLRTYTSVVGVMEYVVAILASERRPGVLIIATTALHDVICPGAAVVHMVSAPMYPFVGVGVGEGAKGAKFPV